MKVEDKNLTFLFLRALVSDDFGQVNNNQKKMDYMADEISNSLRKGIDKNDTLSQVFKSDLFKSVSPKKNAKYKDLEAYLKKYLNIPNALEVLFNCQRIIGPLTMKAMDGNKFNTKKINLIAMDAARRDLIEKGDLAIENVIANWGDYSYEASQVFKDSLGHKLVEEMESQLEHSEHRLDEKLIRCCINSGLALFHARCTQAGKKPAGDGLELSAQLILEHIGKRLDEVPQQITGTLEADHIIKKGGIGSYKLLVSCKTTAKERYKQAMVENRETLLKLNISRIIWFFRKCDLSNKQLLDLGLRGSIVYLPDNSSEFKSFMNNPQIRKYVRPISSIRNSIDDFFDPSYEP